MDAVDQLKLVEVDEKAYGNVQQSHVAQQLGLMGFYRSKRRKRRAIARSLLPVESHELVNL